MGPQKWGGPKGRAEAKVDMLGPPCDLHRQDSGLVSLRSFGTLEGMPAQHPLEGAPDSHLHSHPLATAPLSVAPPQGRAQGPLPYGD